MADRFPVDVNAFDTAMQGGDGAQAFPLAPAPPIVGTPIPPGGAQGVAVPPVAQPQRFNPYEGMNALQAIAFAIQQFQAGKRGTPFNELPSEQLRRQREGAHDRHIQRQSAALQLLTQSGTMIAGAPKDRRAGMIEKMGARLEETGIPDARDLLTRMTANQTIPVEMRKFFSPEMIAAYGQLDNGLEMATEALRTRLQSVESKGTFNLHSPSSARTALGREAIVDGEQTIQIRDEQGNWTEAPADAVKTGLDATIADLTDQDQSDLLNAEAALLNTAGTVHRLLELIPEDSGSAYIGFTGGTAQLSETFLSQGEAFTRTMLSRSEFLTKLFRKEPDYQAPSTDPSDYEEALAAFNLDEQSEQAAKIKSNIVALGYSIAQSNDSGGRLSESDVANAIKELSGGSSGSALQIRAALLETLERQRRNFNNRHLVFTRGQPYVPSPAIQKILDGPGGDAGGGAGDGGVDVDAIFDEAGV